jgi:hypothetical protein
MNGKGREREGRDCRGGPSAPRKRAYFLTRLAGEEKEAAYFFPMEVGEK